MKTTKNVLAATLLLLLFAAGCEKEQVSGEEVKLKSCKHPTDYIRKLGHQEVQLFKKRPEEDRQKWPYGYRYLINETLYVDVSSPDDFPNTFRAYTPYDICNFPTKHIKNWIIPDEGITVIIDGKVFSYRNVQLGFAGNYRFELELTTFKLK